MKDPRAIFLGNIQILISVVIRKPYKKMLKCAILTTECLFHYPLSPKKQTSDSDNNFRCIDFL